MARQMDIDYTQHSFEFSRRWFLNRNLASFREFVYPVWAGKPLVYLELGLFEGMSLVWMMQKVLIHENSRAVGVDPWLMTSKLDGDEMEKVMQRARHNLLPWTCQYENSSKQWRCELVRANSAEVLERMNKRNGCLGIGKGAVDLCMIDGGHNSGAVFDDARMVWPLLRLGGQMLFDDVENDRPKEDHVKQGVKWFVQWKGDAIRRVWKDGYCECYLKLS